MTSFGKLPTAYDKAIDALGEEFSTTLLQYVFKAMELWHLEEKKVTEITNSTNLVSYTNAVIEKFRTRAIMRVGAEREDLWHTQEELDKMREDKAKSD